MATLPSAGSDSTVGVLITTRADDGAITTTQAQLQVLGETATAAGAKAKSGIEQFSSSLKNVGQQMTDVGRNMSMAFTVPIVGIAAASTKMAMEFQQTMELLSTNAGIPQNAIKGLSDKVLALAPQVGAGPDALATAFYHIASAGSGIWDTAKMLDILKISAEGAKIGQASLDDTTYSLTSTMASNIKGAQDAAKTMATLTAIVGAGDMRMQDLNAAIGTGFLGTAATFGISLQSVGAALATLTDNGEHADAAATRLRMTWALMTSPSKQAAKMLGDLGLNSTDAALAADQMNSVFAKSGLTTTKLAVDLQHPNGMNVALKDLQSHLIKAGLNAAETDSMLSKAFGGGRTDAALLTLLQNLDRTDAKFKTISDTTDQFGQKWAEQQKMEKQQFDQAWAGIQSDMIRIGTSIMPQVTTAMKDMAGAINGVTTWYGNLSPNQKQFAIDAAAVLAVSGPLLMFFGTLAKSISSMIDLGSTVGNGLFGKDGLFGKLGDFAKGIPDAFKGGGKIASDWAGTLSDMAKNSATAAGSFARNAADTATAWGKAASDMGKIAAGTVADWGRSFATMTRNSASAAISFTGDALSSAGAWIKAAHNSEIGLGGTLIQMARNSATRVGDMIDNAVSFSSSWVKNSAIASGSAIKESIISSAAWIRSAAASGTAWVTVTLPSIIKDFASTSVAAGINALATSAAWIKNATASSGAWLVANSQMIASWIAGTVVAVAQGAIQGAVWIGNTAKVAAYAVAIDAAKTNTYILGTTTVASAALMAGVIAGLVIDIMLVYNAVQTVIGAFSAMDAANKSAQGLAKSKADEQATLSKLMANGTPEQKLNASTIYRRDFGSGFASGTNHAAGGWSMVGEKGPEAMYVPQGATIKTAAQTSAMGGMGNGVTIHQTNNIYNQADMTEANRQLAFQLSAAV